MSTNLATVSSLYAADDSFQQFEEERAGGIPLEATRYIFCALDYLDPTRRSQLPHLARGGEELLGNPCMRRTTNRFLPRCAITPLELGVELIATDMRPQEGLSVRPMLRLRESSGPEAAGKLFPGMSLYPHYPGELILDATNSGAENKGIVEITDLAQVDWSTGEAQAIQNVFFPEDWIVPIELRLIEERIKQVAKGSKDLKDVAANMLESCEFGRRYANRIIAMENTQVAQRVHPAGHVYSYSAVGRHFAAQLEIKLTASTQETIGAEIAKALAESKSNVDAATLAAVVGEAVKQALAANSSDKAKQRSATGQFVKKGE